MSHAALPPPMSSMPPWGPGTEPTWTRERLTEHLATTGGLTYRYFWQPGPADVVGEHWLGQWQPSPFEVDGVGYTCAEQWMMAAKARLFDDTEVAARILAAPGPREMKALGRQVRGFDAATWIGARIGIVLEGNWHKFTQNPAMGAYLLGTGSDVLVEASPTDRIWGIGYGAGNPRAADPAAWRGANLLGFALMQVRDALREAGSEA